MDTHIFLSALFLGLACATISVTMIDVMAHETILNWWFRFGEKVGKRIVNNAGTTVEVEKWFFKPIWGCTKCFAGQIALWVYVFNHIHACKLQESIFGTWDVYLAVTPDFSFFCLLFAVCVAILSSSIISHIINKLFN